MKYTDTQTTQLNKPLLEGAKKAYQFVIRKKNCIFSLYLFLKKEIRILRYKTSKIKYIKRI